MTPMLKPYINSGYLHVARSLEELAQQIDVDPAGLAATVRQHNEYAVTGIDTEFGKGGNSYDAGNGDAAHRPNPCIGPIGAPPYCAVRVYPTPLGTSLGLRTNAAAQVCTAAGTPIAGLYACGNDMHTIVGGEYPGAGTQLGPAMTFGYVAAISAAADKKS
jgi:3-oxosteroid 1-dehydrogenase